MKSSRDPHPALLATFLRREKESPYSAALRFAPLRAKTCLLTRIEDLNTVEVLRVRGDDAIVGQRYGGYHHIDRGATTTAAVARRRKVRAHFNAALVPNESIRPAKSESGPSAPANQTSSAFRRRPGGIERTQRLISPTVREDIKRRRSSWARASVEQLRDVVEAPRRSSSRRIASGLAARVLM